MTTVFCDICGQPIEDPEMGMIKFHLDEDGGFHDPLVCHKVTCDENDDYLAWAELIWALKGYRNYASLLRGKRVRDSTIRETVEENLRAIEAKMAERQDHNTACS